MSTSFQYLLSCYCGAGFPQGFLFTVLGFFIPCVSLLYLAISSDWSFPSCAFCRAIYWAEFAVVNCEMFFFLFRLWLIVLLSTVVRLVSVVSICRTSTQLLQFRVSIETSNIILVVLSLDVTWFFFLNNFYFCFSVHLVFWILYVWKVYFLILPIWCSISPFFI